MAKNLSFWKNGELLVGLTVLASGLYVAWKGISGIRELWAFYATLLPITLPEDVGKRILASLPLITAVFINTVGSLAAILMGAAWALAGLGESFEAGKKAPIPADFLHPEFVAESVRTGHGQYWKSSWPSRLLGRVWPRARLVSPVSYEILNSLVILAIKVLFAGIVIWGALSLLELIPALAKRHANVDVRILVPSARGLFVLLGVLLVVYVCIAASLVPLRRPQFVRSSERLWVRGSGGVQALFALVEEGCRLLTASGVPPRSPIRLEDAENPEDKATLVETPPESLRSVARPVAYACLPLAFLFLALGFTRLIHFPRPAALMPWHQFLTELLPRCVMEIAFALGLIIVGLHFAERARKLFGVRRYRSALIFVRVRMVSDTAPLEPSSLEQESQSHGDPGIRWTMAEAADDDFSAWVRAPQHSGRFSMEVLWAEAISESATRGGQRFLTSLRESPALSAAVTHIIQIPFHVRFESDGVS